MGEESWGFDPPPFDAAAARVQLQRALRDLRLTERGQTYLLQGRPVVEVGLPSSEAPGTGTAAGDAIAVRLARRPAVTPQWEARSLRSSGQVRQFVDDVRRRLASWQDDD